MNCLTLNLVYWDINRDYKLVYDSDHVLCIPRDLDLSDKRFIDIKEYGIKNIVNSFNIKNGYYLNVLNEYFQC